MKKFDHVKLSELDFNLKARTNLGRRDYVTPSGKTYPSVTTILSTLSKDYLIEWRKRIGDAEADKIVRIASARGTKFHDACEKYLLNEMDTVRMMSLMPDAKQLLVSVKPEFDKHIGKIYCLEQALYSDRLKVAGRVDCVAEWDGILSIVDFKNSLKLKREEDIWNYFSQCTMYACMIGELTGRPVRQIVVAVGIVDRKEPQIFVKRVSDYLEDTIKLIRNYHLTNPM
ncbi:PD-(D/E)XK nuclease family protein [Candidatus Dojkabacteria bacterium]|jgi:genome maintenance exonuclease 1|nr:PD-(D/E)XK nuclease family protein [Candidatus Dojkabacteria bacterium]